MHSVLPDFGGFSIRLLRGSEASVPIIAIFLGVSNLVGLLLLLMKVLVGFAVYRLNNLFYLWLVV